MANLDRYEQEAAQGDLGEQAANKLKSTAKGQAKKQGRKLAKKGTKKLMEKTGLSAAKKAAGQGVKAALKAIATAGKAAIKSAVTFLVSNPYGWIVLVVLIVILIAVSEKMEHDRTKELESAVVMEEDGSLSDEGVAILMSDCPKPKSEGGDVVDGDLTMENNARKIYSVGHAFGLNDYCISGILGNLFAEGSVDPTTVEGIYDERYALGEKKTNALADLDTYFYSTLKPNYEKRGIHNNWNAYVGPDGKRYCGLGLVQWTGPAGYALLNFAQSTGHEWHSMEFQLAYMFSDAHYRPGFFAGWMAEQSTSPEEAATYFAAGYEGNTRQAQEERRASAAEWYEKMQSWSVDENLAESVLALSQTMGAVAADTAIGEAADNCPDTDLGPYDNSSIANAAVSYAYPTRDEGRGNNGTALYVQVHDNIFPGDSWYRACDRTVACAVRWSGSDDDFPPGNTGAQCDYLASSPKWESIGKLGSLTEADLKPGDVLALNGHVLLYVGHEAIELVHKDKADADADSVSGSLNERSPGCGNDTKRLLSRGGADWEGRGEYEVFRCVNPDNSETYKNAGASAVLE